MVSRTAGALVLSVRGKQVELDDSVTVGRSGTCDVVLHRDEEASRVHARFFLRDEVVFVEDLSSTNGTFVGGERVVGTKRLELGDLVRVGSSLITLTRAEPAFAGRMAAMAAVDNRPNITAMEATRPADIFEVLERVARKSIEAGAPEEAERVTAAHLGKLRQELETGTVETEHVERAIRIAASLAQALPSARWLDYLVEVHALLGRPLDEQLGELVCASSEANRISPSGLRAYCRRLADQSSSLTISERMTTLRLQQLLPDVARA